jgi:filamentous hemagglutinin
VRGDLFHDGPLLRVETGVDPILRDPLTSGGARRAAQFGENWQSASLKETVGTVAGDSPVVSPAPSGKVIYTNPDTGLRVVYDPAGNYFRVENPALAGELRYMDQFGKPTPKNVPLVKPGRTTQTGVPPDVRKALTHFTNSD